MAGKRKEPKGKKINPTFFVFCEGDTEESYINFLKSVYRLPSIHIHPKIGRNNISKEYIKNYKADKPTHEKDLNFLVYDLDVPHMLEKLTKIDDCILLVSNPCIEFWFLLHYKNHSGATDSAYCCKELTNRNKSYKKGDVDIKLREKLLNNKEDATKRAKHLVDFKNPSSTMYILIEKLNDLKITRLNDYEHHPLSFIRH